MDRRESCAEKKGEISAGCKSWEKELGEGVRGGEETSSEQKNSQPSTVEGLVCVQDSGMMERAWALI